MKFQFWSIGKAHESYVKEGIEMFTKRIANYFSVNWKIFPPLKNSASLNEKELKLKEGEVILNHLDKDDFLIALEEKGKMIDSLDLAKLIQTKSNESIKNIIFLIGGAYGLSEAVLKKANIQWSLSQLVFPHQLVRLILAEQVYRACTIIKNEKYHHI